METIKTSKFDLEKEIHRINREIENLQKTMNDYRIMQAGQFTRSEIKQEIEQLKLERNELLAQLP